MLSHKTRYVDGCGSVKKSEEVGNLAPAFSKQKRIAHTQSSHNHLSPSLLCDNAALSLSLSINTVRT